MKKFLKYPLYSHLWKTRVSYININRMKYDFLESDEETNKKNSKTLRKSNSKLLEKILGSKNETIKIRMFKSYIQTNPNSRWKAISISHLLKCKIKKNETEMSVETNKCPVIVSSCSIPKQPEVDDSPKVRSFERPKRGEPAEVIWGFIPKEWTKFFVPMTGHSGFYTFLFTFCTYLLSKEKYVCDHEYYNGISLAILCIYCVKNYGPYVARYLDKEIDKYEKELNESKDQMKQNYIDSIDFEKKSQDCMEEQLVIVQAKRENVHLQREAEYRKRQMEVYEHVKRILDYQVGIEEVRKNIQHKNLIHWVTKEVENSLTPELKENYLQLCLADIESILKAHKEETGNK
ncbi:hypothetical protein WA026_003080 [Henosepilachna vigintioctopunctata]|uniref:ATP synthase subunit b n=1 Tax=Henosepilachna vigintioctopunctata TaxID=420089 RepID=A0AAW1TNK7_9CUCU